MVLSIQVPEESMNRDDVELRCPGCGEPIYICTKPGVTRRKNNPVNCEHCQAALIIRDDIGNDLNFWWIAGASDFELEILEMLGGGVFPDRTTADRFRRAVRDHGEEAVRGAAERVVEQHQGKPLGTWLIGDVLHLVKKSNYAGVSKVPAQPQVIKLNRRFEEE